MVNLMAFFRKGRPGLILLSVIIYYSFSGLLAQPITDPERDNFLDNLLSRMTIEEKIGQMNMFDWPAEEDSFQTIYKQMILDGKIGSFLGIHGVNNTRELQRIAVEESRLGIPLLFAFDVIHGWKTVFPVPLAEACSWDVELVERTARMAAVEATSSGIHWTFAPMVDIARDPRWGRIVEGSGEDPFLGSMMAAARVKGFQGKNLAEKNTLLACAKHFVAYGGAEGGRDYNTVDISERTLHEIYLPPFFAAVKAGVGSIMSAFNEIGGVPMQANDQLLTELLIHQWGFTGVVVSDWTAIEELRQHGIAADAKEAAMLAIQAGVDVDMVSSDYLNELPVLLKEGRITEDLINRAARRVLKAKYDLGLFTDPYRYHDIQREQTEILTAKNLQLARDAARKSIVLLKNSRQILPLKKDIKSLAIIGALAIDKSSSLGAWSAIGDTSNVISVFKGIRQAVSLKTKIYYHDGYDLTSLKDTGGFKGAVAIARKCEVVILVLGEPARMCGEAASRFDIRLPGNQEKLARKIIDTKKPVILLLMNGRPLALDWLAEEFPAIVETWYLGIQMGNAVADVIFGDYNPSGKLAVTFPRSTGQIPIYYNHKNTGRPPANDNHYTSKYIDLPWTPLYPFGYGLSYTTFVYGNLICNKSTITIEDSLHVQVEVTNNGSREGEEIVQLYIQDEVGSVTRPVKELKDFKKIHLRPGETNSVEFIITSDMLSFYDQQMNKIIEPGKFKVFVGESSENFLEADFEVIN